MNPPVSTPGLDTLQSHAVEPMQPLPDAMKPDKPDPADEALASALRASRVLVDAPEALIQRAVHLFEFARRSPAAPGIAPALLPRLLAVLKFDSGSATPAAYGRRSGTAEVRQLLYAMDDCDVDLRVAAGAGGLYGLSGQLLGPFSHGLVSIRPAPAMPGQAPAAAAVPADAGGQAALNELGEFQLPPMPAGIWQLTLQFEDRVIELPPLHLASDGRPLV